MFDPNTVTPEVSSNRSGVLTETQRKAVRNTPVDENTTRGWA